MKTNRHLFIFKYKTRNKSLYDDYCHKINTETGDYALSAFYQPVPSTCTVVHHHQPINVPTSGAQVFLMDYT
jgi:hypothetical protein